LARSVFKFTLALDLPVDVRARLFGARTETGTIHAEIPGAFAKGNLVFASLNCAWIVEDALKALGVSFVVTPPKAHTKIKWSDVVAATKGELRDWVPDFMAIYQKLGVVKLVNDPDESGHLHMPTGSGKSLTFITWGLFRPGTLVLVTKASNRRGLQREFQRYTTVEPVMMFPSAERKKKDPDPAQVIATAMEAGAPPRAIIVGWETVPDFIDVLLSTPITSLVIDEIHKGQNHKRWAKIPGAMETGQERPEFRQLTNIAACMSRLSSNSRRRLGATATPLPDRRRNLWAQLDLVHPRSFGKAWDFFHRYCDVTLTNHGNLDNSGKSNTEELDRRLAFVRHHVDSSVTRRELPPCRRQVLYITKSQQSAPGAFAKELAKASKIGARRALVEIRLAEAASRKRNVLVEYVKDAVAGEGAQGKVVVFTGRHNDCDRLLTAITKGCPGVQVWMAHGGHAIKERDAIKDAFMAHPGPCVLIGTGNAWGESHSLQDTDLAIFAQLPINARELWQWEGRFTRHGQKRPVLIVYPVAEGTVDEHMKSILLDKLPDVADLQKDSAFESAVGDLQASGMSDDEIVDSLFEKIVGGTAEGDAA